MHWSILSHNLAEDSNKFCKFDKIYLDISIYPSIYRDISRKMRYIGIWYIEKYQNQDISQYFYEKKSRNWRYILKNIDINIKWYILIYRYDLKHTQLWYIKIYHIKRYIFKKVIYWYILIYHKISLYLKIPIMTFESESSHQSNFKD